MGNTNQWQVVQAATRVCMAYECDFAIHTGDNIYDIGVSSVEDEQFYTKFEEPFARFEWPVYLVLGDHDTMVVDGNGDDNGRFQIAYTERSAKWRMPDRYYSLETGPATFAFLELTRVDRAGTESAYARDQASWFSGVLDNAKTPWRVAVGHYPTYSNGEHGDENDYDGTPSRAFTREHVCGRADLYFSGDEHDLEWLLPPAECAGTEQIISGAAGRARALGTERTHEERFAVGDTLGFFWVELREDGMRAMAFDGDGRLLHEHTAAAPRR